MTFHQGTAPASSLLLSRLSPTFAPGAPDLPHSFKGEKYFPPASAFTFHMQMNQKAQQGQKSFSNKTYSL